MSKIVKLINALRSNNYKQGKHGLRFGTTYDALGVACDLYIQETGLASWRMKMTEQTFLDLGCEAEHYGIKIKVEDITKDLNPVYDVMPPEVYKWFGFLSSNPIIYGKALSQWNDIDKKSFEEIADMLENKLIKGVRCLSGN